MVLGFLNLKENNFENWFLKIKMKHGKESCIRSFNDYFEALVCCTFLNSRFDFIMGIFHSI